MILDKEGELNLAMHRFGFSFAWRMPIKCWQDCLRKWPNLT